jgi:outer membrane lipoprotein LolB
MQKPAGGMFRRRACALLLSIMVSVVMSGCQTFSGQPKVPVADKAPTEQALAQRAALSRLARWQAQGKLKVVVKAGREFASFDWQQSKQNYAINFFGPLGYGSSWLKRTSKGVTLESPGHHIRFAATPEALLQQTVGWQAPISELQYWIKGLPAPVGQVISATTDPNGVYTGFVQSGWQLTLSGHRLESGVWLPGRLVAERQGVVVTLVITRWVLP